MAEEEKPSSPAGAAADAANPETPETEGEAPAGGGSRKQLIIIIVGVVAGVIFGIVVIFMLLMFTPLANKLIKSHPTEDHSEKALEEEKKEKLKKLTSVVYYSVPDVLVNISSDDQKRKKSFLKLKVLLEVQTAEESKQLELIAPRIVDQMQVYLRELTLQDVQGTNGIIKLREQLLIRINAVTSPIEVKDVLFDSLILK